MKIKKQDCQDAKEAWTGTLKAIQKVSKDVDKLDSRIEELEREVDQAVHKKEEAEIEVEGRRRLGKKVSKIEDSVPFYEGLIKRYKLEVEDVKKKKNVMMGIKTYHEDLLPVYKQNVEDLCSMAS